MVQEYKQGDSSASDQMVDLCLQGRKVKNVNRMLRNIFTRFCANIGIAGETEVLCNVDCPVDCSLSPWSAWDRSSCQCGLVLTNITRQRLSCVIST